MARSLCPNGWSIVRSHRTSQCGTSRRPDGTFSRVDFVVDQERIVYICPGGAELTSTGNIDQGHIVYYRANKKDCSACALPARILFDHLVCALLKK